MHLTWIQRYTKLCLALCGIFAVFLFLIPSLLNAQSFNQEINYQGKLLDDTGAPVADGSYSMVFRLYTVSSGGTHIWTETQSVTVQNGLFSVMLGDVSSLASVNFNQTLYLGINVAADGEMTPRKVLGAVPAAFEAENANTVGGIATSSFLRSDQADTLAATAATTLLTIQQSGAGNILDLFDGATNVFTVRDGGNVGIGTTSPARTLVVDGDFELTGGIFDNNGTRGSNGYVLQTTGDGVEWVATSSLGFASAGSAHDPVTLAGTPNYITLSGQQLTLTQLDLADDVATFASSVLAGRLTDETGTGNVVFSASPTFTGTALFSGATFTAATSTQLAISSLTSGRVPYVTTSGRLIDSANFTFDGTNLVLGTDVGLSRGAANRLDLASGDNLNLASGALQVNNTTVLRASTTLGIVALGQSAGQAFRAGMNGNTYLGAEAGGAHRSGLYSTFVGNGAGSGLATTTSSVVIGSAAGYGLAGEYSASELVIIGDAAGFRLQTGSSWNTLIGSRAGEFITTGAANIVLGYYAARNLTTGSNNIAIGYDIDLPSATASNQLNIGNLIFGTGIDGTGTTLSSGNIGIGTSTPTQRLTVAGGFRLTGAFHDRNNSAGTNGFVLQSTATGVQWVATSSLGFASAGSAHDAVTLAGTPNYITLSGQQLTLTQLDLADDISSFASSVLAGRLTDETGTGNVVFSASPTFTGVAGFAGATFTSATSTQLAISSLTSGRVPYTTTGGRLRDSANFTFDGTNLGFGNTQGIAWGGIRALYASTTRSNYFFGEQAGSSITSAGNNIAIGYLALTNANSGGGNIAIGSQAARSLTTGSDNVFIGGVFTGYENTSGTDNIFIGYAAGFNNRTGGGNVMIGNSAGSALRSGDNNSVYGRFAAQGLATSSNSTIIGHGAAFGLAGDFDADNLTILGREAGYSLQTGADNNILIGYNAANALTTGANNIVIGYDIDLQNNAWSNRLNIGNLIFGTGIDGTGTTLSSGNIGIGTSTPNSRLQVYVSNTTTASPVASLKQNSTGDAGLGFVLGTANSFVVGIDNSDSDKFKLSYGSAANAALGTNDYLTVTTAGNVGIGTTTPNQKLSIFANAADAAVEFSTVSGASEKWTIGIDDSDGAKFKISSSSALGTNDRFVINGAGFVGIGDSSPTALFTVGSGDLFTINSSGVISSSNNITPNSILSTGQTDEYCLTYESSGTTFEWQTCGSGGSGLATTSIDTSAELRGILTDETGTGRAVFSASPAFSGTATFSALTATGTATFSTVDINGGAVDGTTIGASSASTIIGTTVTTNTGLVPDANDGAYLGLSGTAFSDLFLATGAVVGFGNGDVSITHALNNLAFSGASSNYTFDAPVTAAADNTTSLGVSGTAWSDLFLASGAVIDFFAGDVTLTHGTNQLTLAGGTFVAASTTLSGLLTANTVDINGGVLDATVIGGASPAAITGTTITATTGFMPDANDGAYLGQSGTAFSDLFLASGAVIGLAGGDVTITHSANTLAFAGGALGYTFDNSITPSTNDGGSLGASGTAWGDLFLASGAVVNFNAGDVTLTHSADTLTVAGGTFVAATTTISNGTTLTANGRVTLGDNGDTVAINSNDWDITTAGTITGAEWQGTAVADTYVADILTIGTGSTIADDLIVEADLFIANAASDELCLTYESDTTNFAWQTCGSGGSGLATTSIDTSAELRGILTDETGTGRAVFSASPAFSGTATFSALTATGTATFASAALTSATTTQLAISSLTSGRIPYVTTGGRLIDSASFAYNGNDLNLGTTKGIAWGGDRIIKASSTKSAYFFGNLAGEYITTGGNNIGIGSLALQEATSSSNNIAIGSEAGRRVSSGGANVFIGPAFAGTYNTSGSLNVFIGYAAGVNNDTGSENTLLGNNAGYALLSGDGNSMLGTYVGFNLATSSQSTIIGAGAAWGFGGAYQANNLTILGREAGFNLETGADNNILIGYNAANALTTGANNIVIGYDIDLQNNTWSNRLNIGNLIFGTGIDGTGTTLSSGNIGIGTSTPPGRLSVQTTGSTDILNLFETGGVEVFTVLESGYVGIGDSTPEQPLDVLGTVATNYVAAFNNSSATGYGQYLFVNNADGDKYALTIDNSSGNIFQVLNNGRVGIGDSSPEVLLDVSGSTAGNYITTVVNSSATGYGQYIYVNNTSASANALEVENSSGSIFRVRNDGNVGIGVTAPSAKLDVWGDFRVGTSTTNALVYANTANRQFLIGTSSEIAEHGNLDIPLMALSGTNGNGRLTMLLIREEVTGQYQAPSLQFERSSFFGDTKMGAINFQNSASIDAWTDIGDSAAGNLRFITDAPGATDAGFERMRITSTGNVGIGSSTPNHLLTVGGNINIGTPTGSLFMNSQRVFYASTTNQSVALGQFAGNALLGSAVRNTALGYRALRYATSSTNNTAVGFAALEDTTSGNGNTAVGNQALTFNTTGYQNTAVGSFALSENIGGFRNTAVGEQAMSSNTSGTNNTAVGMVSLFSNTTGDYNVALGDGSLYALTTGNRNIAIGYNALDVATSTLGLVAVGHEALTNNTWGDANTALGYRTLRQNTTGYDNTAVGYDAMYSNTTGYNNTAVGQYALDSNTIGYRNTALGADSMSVNTEGYQNTAIGGISLFSNTTGYRNVAVGDTSLYDNTTGYHNVAVGFSSLANNTTGISNVVMGYNAMNLSIDGQYNVAVGDSALATATSSDFNTALGFYSLNKLTTGYENTALGANALRNITSGYNNIAIGTSAGVEVRNGVQNVIIGSSALGLNRSGSYNVAIGFLAGYDIVNATSTGWNTIVGYNTGRGITTGTNNTILGANVTGLSATLSNNIIIADGSGNRRINVDSSGNVGIGTTTPTTRLSIVGDLQLYDDTPTISIKGTTFIRASTSLENIAIGGNDTGLVTRGDSNLFFGNGAGNALATNNSRNVFMGINAGHRPSGSNSVYIGYASGYGLGGVYTASQAVVVGSEAGMSMNTGSSNSTLIGFRSGYSISSGANNITLGAFAGDNLTTGSNNIAIGYDIDMPSVSASNRLNIGNLLFGTGIDGTGTTLSSGNIGIGTSTPNQRLTIFKNGADAAIEFSTVSGSAEKWTIGIDDSDRAKFKISSSSALGTNDRLVIDGLGRVGIGTSTPTQRFHVVDDQSAGYVARISNINTANTADGLLISLGVAAASRATTNYFVGFSTSNGTVAGKIQGGASAVAYTTTGADLAEFFPVHRSEAMPEKGEIVMLDSGYERGVKRAQAGAAPFGIVTTNPGFVGNGPICNLRDTDCDEDYAEDNALVSLIGQVPLKVNADNGPIAVGDSITISTSTAGVGMRANFGDRAVAYALEDLPAGDTEGTIRVYVTNHTAFSMNPDPRLLDPETDPETLTGDTIMDRIVKLVEGFVDGVLRVAGLRTNTICLEDSSGETCIDRATLDALLENAATPATQPATAPTDPTPEPEPEPTPTPEPEPEPKPSPAPETEPEPTPEPVAEPAPQPAPAPEEVADPEPTAEPTPEP